MYMYSMCMLCALSCIVRSLFCNLLTDSLLLVMPIHISDSENGWEGNGLSDAVQICFHCVYSHIHMYEMYVCLLLFMYTYIVHECIRTYCRFMPKDFKITCSFSPSYDFHQYVVQLYMYI